MSEFGTYLWPALSQRETPGDYLYTHFALEKTEAWNGRW